MIDLAVFPAFILILTRVSAFFLTIPVFSNKNLPVIHKIGLALFLSWIMLYAINPDPVPVNSSFLILIIKEAMIGLSIGFIAAIVFYAIQVAGGFIDLQMGFAIANVFDPQTGIQTPLMGRYLYTFAVLFLLATDAHHMLLDGIFYSYKFLPLDSAIANFGNGSMTKFVISVFSGMFLVALQMAIPIVGTLFLADLALGIVARTVPQMNIFVIGLPLKILIALVLFLVVMPAFFVSIQLLVDQMRDSMVNLLELLGAA
ncbi:flagellar biosynthetic protein FliR [Fictibacillus barbaricus]|uniref:Flagellar biosynthetic protein FliR n=1 Tax=Fictibacillus barbaricus TaxID=182136 RepID=A0ABS2ZER5_9BACL|nr:flagellar biosynthetic protein FliR [Fictibacillus barbaricus]MBN3545833.1 flagellar type III secretion system protein FliR [Fictibacillus barbaricus]GGB56472.1 flagellar biosynthetic protein FliR [Fictibacillus barbaricus]